MISPFYDYNSVSLCVNDKLKKFGIIESSYYPSERIKECRQKEKKERYAQQAVQNPSFM